MAKQPQSCPAFRTTIGGQALIEGIMMLGPDKKAIVVRKADGELEVKEEARKLIKDKCAILGWPLIRGVVNFGSSIINGVRALFWSADLATEEEETPEEPSKLDQWLEKHLGSEKMASLAVGLAAVLGILFSVGLFFLLPTFIAGFFDRFLTSPVIHNLIEGILRIVIFMLYLFLCSRMKDMKRVFSYHGAEHKTIFCYEAGLPLTVENVRIQPRHHPRCGTSFLFVVIFISILVSSVVFGIWPVTNPLLRFGAHLLMLPIIVGVSYEFNRWAGRSDCRLSRILRAPGLWMQNFTTFEPDDSMIEVGIKALELVLPENKGEDEW